VCLGVLGGSTAALPARAWELGAHVGVGLDSGSIHLGGDLVAPLAQVSSSARLSIWPSAAFVINDGQDGLLLGADFPFEFRIDGSIVAPFVGPGLGVAIFGDTQLKLNVIGGVFIDAGTVRPFGELALRFIRGVYADLLIGVLFEL